MKNTLIAIGCSFTYGEGLEFHYWKDNYPSTYSRFFDKTSYEPCKFIMDSVESFMDYRQLNRYAGVLKRFLNFELIHHNENGGCNFKNIQKLDTIIQHLSIEKNLTPAYCVFQFTNIIRDVNEFMMQEYDANNWLSKELYAELKENIIYMDAQNKTKINNTIKKVFEVILSELLKRFKTLEKLGCKTVFFVGLDDKDTFKLIKPLLEESEYYLPIIFQNTEYRSWDHMNRENYLTLRQHLGANDDHPCLQSHHWMANQLYKKYLEITK